MGPLVLIGPPPAQISQCADLMGHKIILYEIDLAYYTKIWPYNEQRQ